MSDVMRVGLPFNTRRLTMYGTLEFLEGTTKEIVQQKPHSDMDKILKEVVQLTDNTFDSYIMNFENQGMYLIFFTILTIHSYFLIEIF